MPEYVPVLPAEDLEPTTPPPYMDPANSILKKKSVALHKKLSQTGQAPKRCEHCGAFPQPQHVMIWPAPRPAEHIRPENTKFIGYVILIALVIFLLFAACKYLP